MAPIVPLVKQTFLDFQRHKTQWLAAAISYFTVFAIAPLIIVVVEIAGAVLGQHQSALSQIYGNVSEAAGPSASNAVQSLVSATFNEQRSGPIAQYAAWGAFLLAALGLVSSVQQALDTVWDVTPQRQGIIAAVWTYVQSFVVVLAIALLLLVSLVITTALTAASAQLTQMAPYAPILAKVVDFVVSFAVITVLFALLFEYLPHCRIAWHDVWPGAAMTSLLFVCGQFLISWYLGRTGVSSTYGAFGSLVVFLLWVNYSAQIMLLGAEFTHVYARRASPSPS